MNDLIFAINAVFPIILMIAVGYVFKKIGLLDQNVATKLNTLVFRVFLPIMLFLNVYKIESFDEIDLTFVFYAVIVTVLICIIGIPILKTLVKKKSQMGVMLQGLFSANYALVGLPLAQSLMGDEGSIMASLLSAFIVPVFNVLAVVSLTVFSESDKKLNIPAIIKGIFKNPLIQAILCGVAVLGIRAVLESLGINFRISNITPIYKTLQNLSSIATPLSLIVLGAKFELSSIPTLKKHIIVGTLGRCAIIPFISITLAVLIGKFNGAQFASFIACFCTPVAISSVPMSQEMGADAELMGQLVVWTTLFSSISIFLSSYILKMLGIF